MNIAIIGAGSIGRALAEKWITAGQHVVVGRRTGAQSVDAVVNVDIDTALSQDVIVLAIPGNAVEEFLTTNAAKLADKLLIDASNSIGRPDMHHAAIADQITGLRYARAFNSLGVENIVEPRIAGVELDMFFTSSSEDRDTVARLITDVGFHPVWLGEGADAASTLDGLTRAWFALAIGQGRGRHLGFKVIS